MDIDQADHHPTQPNRQTALPSTKCCAKCKMCLSLHFCSFNFVAFGGVPSERWWPSSSTNRTTPFEKIFSKPNEQNRSKSNHRSEEKKRGALLHLVVNRIDVHTYTIYHLFIRTSHISIANVNNAVLYGAT